VATETEEAIAPQGKGGGMSTGPHDAMLRKAWKEAFLRRYKVKYQPPDGRKDEKALVAFGDVAERRRWDLHKSLAFFIACLEVMHRAGEQEVTLKAAHRYVHDTIEYVREMRAVTPVTTPDHTTAHFPATASELEASSKAMSEIQTLLGNKIAPATTEAQFKAFHEANPHVYDQIVEMSNKLQARGHKRGGIKMLFEVLRWKHMSTNDPSSDFKLNNNYAPHYARMAMQEEPDLDGFFELRELRS
jgi:hypothetical protein